MRRTVSLGMPLAVAGLLLAACDNIADLRGFSPSPGSVDKLEVKTQSREDVQRLIGTPSAVATFNPNVWYYISAKQNITMVARVTPTSGKELTVLEQILGNVGKFSGPRQQANPGAPTGGGI